MHHKSWGLEQLADDKVKRIELTKRGQNVSATNIKLAVIKENTPP